MNKLCALFAYGTLKPGEEAQHYLNQIAGIWHDAYVFGKYITTLDIDYPIIQLDLKGEKIVGKLFCSNQLSNIIEDIDEYEGDKYKRSISDVYLKNGSKIKAYIYTLNIK
jgi:gamma-glutamylcyclotransferase (GGCT)/AIG2-like uncharacterized protein YtfP